MDTKTITTRATQRSDLPPADKLDGFIRRQGLKKNNLGFISELQSLLSIFNFKVGGKNRKLKFSDVTGDEHLALNLEIKSL